MLGACHVLLLITHLVNEVIEAEYSPHDYRGHSHDLI